VRLIKQIQVWHWSCRIAGLKRRLATIRHEIEYQQTALLELVIDHDRLQKQITAIEDVQNILNQP
jgi:hypothetical protein